MILLISFVNAKNYYAFLWSLAASEKLKKLYAVFFQGFTKLKYNNIN